MIWFMRHGDAENGEPDWERRLTDKGRRQARAAGAALEALGVEFDLCIASPRVRARETAELACDELGAELTLDERLAGGRFDPLAELTGGSVDMKKGGLAGVDDRALRVLLRPRETQVIATVGRR
jgi:phosphohistidine phosphatase